MAKSSRATRVKNNKTNLRNRVFGPIEDARAQRLSERLMQIASQPLPEKPEKMEVESAKPKPRQKANKEGDSDAMELDQDAMQSLPGRHQKRQVLKSNRVHKKHRVKPSSQVTFPKGRRAPVQSNRRGKR